MESLAEDLGDLVVPKKFKKNKSNRSGIDYEVMLPMLFLKRADENHYTFELATEVTEAEKFDDLYYQDFTTKKRVYLLQAKHKDDTSKQIHCDDLRSQSYTDFSLVKYFNSYRKIKKKGEFKKNLGCLNLIVCTTINLDCKNGKTIRNSKSIEVVELKDSDGIFKENNRELGKRYKLRIEDPEEREEIFRNSYSSLKVMANKLVQCALEGKLINIEQLPAIRRYHVALEKEIIDVERKKFHSAFINDPKSLSERAQNFRDIFYKSVAEFLSTNEALLVSLYAKEREKAEKVFKDFKEITDGGVNGIESHALNKKLGNIELQLLENFGKLQIKNLPLFVEELSDIINDSRVLEINKNTDFGRNIRKLGGHVLVIEHGKIKFNENFLTNEVLPFSFRDFRNKLKEKLGEDNFSKLSQVHLSFKLANENDSNIFRDGIRWVLDEECISDGDINSEIDEFLEIFQFIVTPKAAEIKEIIKGELQEEFGPKGENIYYALIARTVDWINCRDEDGHGYSLSHNNNIYTVSKKECLGTVWFDVKKNVISFTGREEKLDEVTNNMQEGIVVICGLSGVGKTELALKYAHSKYNENHNVLWIDCETRDSAKESFHRLCKQLRFRIKDEDGDEKSLKAIGMDLFDYFADAKSLFIFDNAGSLSMIEEFLPQSSHANKLLITSSNSLDWKGARQNIKSVFLDDFTNSEAVEFVKKALPGRHESRDIENLTKKLHNFPLALQQAVTYIRDTREEFRKRGLEFGIRDYLERYEKIPKMLLEVDLPADAHTEGTFKTFGVTAEKIVASEKYGSQALDMLNITSYFSSNNIPEETFLNYLADGSHEALMCITRLLIKYSAVSLDGGMLNIHGLLQEVRRLELQEKQEEHSVADRDTEEKVLEKALKLLSNYVGSRDSINGYIPHIVSVWNYASKYDRLVQNFIVEDVVDSIASSSEKGGSRSEREFVNATKNTANPLTAVHLNKNSSTRETRRTTYFHIISGSCRYEVVELVFNKVKTSLCDVKMLHKFINVRSEDKKTLLHYAAQGGDARTVKLLLQNKANVDTRDKLDNRPLHLAAKNGHLAAVNELLNKKANVNAKTSPKFQFTPLHSAAQNGHVKIVKVLLEKRAEVNAQTEHGCSPLHLAAKYNYLKVVRLLLSEGADMNLRTKDGYTALHFATKNCHLDIVDVLVRNGADINAADQKNFTALHWAALNGSTEIVGYLLKNHCIDVNVESTKGKTALQLAEEKGHLKVVAALRSKSLC